MGLLDDFAGFIKTPEGQGLLSGVAGWAAGARKGTPWNNVGRGGLAGIMGYGNALEQQAQFGQAEQMKQMNQMQMDKLRQQLDQAENIKRLARNSVLSPESQAIGKFGPTTEGAEAIGQFKPQFDTEKFLSGMMAEDPLQAMQLRQSLIKAPIKLGQGDMLLDPSTYKPLAQGMPKEDATPSAIKEYNFAVGQGYKGTFDQWDMQRKRATASVTNVNMDNLGLKPKDRFEMEDKLRNDYSKATDMDQKILGTSQKMKAILSGDPTAMKDQAAIYSFAKLLDPDGAVREADYAAITNTAGIVDRMKNYANKIATGQMLTQNQRDEMGSILNKWESVAKKRIATQQKSYSGRAKMYNLSPENVYQTEVVPTAGDQPDFAAAAAAELKRRGK